MTLKEAYNYCVSALHSSDVDEADFKALCLVCSLLNIKNSEYPFYLNQNVDEAVIYALLNRLKNGEPLQYVIGKWDFYDREFYVGKGVLIPRPETEELVEKAIIELKNFNKPVVYDLCAGSGCIGLTLADKTDGTVYLVEKSAEAFEYLKKNANGINNAILINADINSDIKLPPADMIISNPPYIKSEDLESLQSEVRFEPDLALDGGHDGLDFYRIINDKWSARLNADGILLLEIGNEQGEDIKTILFDFKDIEVIKDIYGNDRIVKAIKR